MAGSINKPPVTPGQIFVDETGFDAVIDQHGEKRLLALTPPKPKAMPTLEASGIEIIPRTEWDDLLKQRGASRLSTIGNNCCRYDQGQVGKCEPTAEVECVGQLRALNGLPKTPLSSSMLYSFINGGRDQGASIGDGYPVLQQFGVCKENTVSTGFLTRGQIPQTALVEARSYRALKAVHCPSFDEIVTAWFNGWAVVNGVCVGGRFNNLDAEGVYPVTRGMPNHAVSMWDLRKLKSGQWCLWDCNHWRRTWGVDGDFGCSEACYEALGYQDAIAYQVVSIDEATDMPPALPG
jgi:hypothetical protein